MYRLFKYILFSCFITCDIISTHSTNSLSLTQQDVSTPFADSVKETKDVVTIIPTFARCMPEKQVVKIGPPPDSTQFYVPSCTRIERCGGCCTQDNLLSCQPEEKVTVNLLVTLISPSKHAKARPLAQRVIVPMEKHIKCKCDCIVKPENCNVLQEYVKNDCTCVCTNKDERAKCKEDENNKHWDPHTCTCHCKEVKECQTGYLFNKHTCSCEAQRTRIRYNGPITYSESVTYTKLQTNRK